jgi:hypothetical protein
MAEDKDAAQTVRIEHAAAKGEDRGGASVPSFRLREESERRRVAEASAADLTAQLETLKGEYEKTNSGLRELQTSHGQDMHLIELGFKAPSVRRFFRREYVDSVAELAADARPTFNDWLNENASDPLYSVHFERLKGTAPAAEPNSEPAPVSNPSTDLLSAVRAMIENGNPNAGTSQPAAHNGRQYSGDEISAIRGKNSGKLGLHKDAVLATLRAEGLIK